MATGSVALEKLQGAIEVAEGDAAAPTRWLYAGPPGSFDDSDVQKREAIEDRRTGSRTGLNKVYNGIENSTFRVSGAPGGYESFGWWLALIAPTGGVAGAVVDTTAYTRTFTPVEGTTLNDYGVGYHTANLEFAAEDLASTIVRQMPAMRVSNFVVNWSKRASGTDTGFTFDAELMMTTGTATNGTAFTGAVSDTTNTLAIGNHHNVFIDSSTIGSTQDTNVTAASFNLVNPVSFHDGMDNTVGHTSAHHAQQWTPTMTMTRKFSDMTELDAYLAKTARKVRIESIGGVVGATTATNIIRLDFYGYPTDYRKTEVDGIIYADLDFEGYLDTTATTAWTAFIQNDVSAAYTAT